MEVITYQSPAGHRITLSERQVRHLNLAGKWPLDSTGQEYRSVSHGLHDGQPISDDDVADIVPGDESTLELFGHCLG